MNWDALGAIAELLGGLGVILTLFYLALQIRASNLVASAQSRQSMSGFASWLESYTRSRGFRECWEKESASFSADFSKEIDERIRSADPS